MKTTLKYNIVGGTYLVTMAIIVYLIINGHVEDNIWDSDNYFVITLFVTNGISMVVGLFYFIADLRI